MVYGCLDIENNKKKLIKTAYKYQRLKKLNLPSLEHQHKRGDMITCYIGLNDFFLLNKRNT